MAVTTATQAKTTLEPAVERLPPVIDPNDVKIQREDFCSKAVVVNAPDDLTLDDLGNHPEIWKKVQISRTGKALVEYDTVEIRAFDWTVWAVVDHADLKGVQFYKKWDKKDKRVRDRRPWADELYYVAWTKDGYAYFRKDDDQRMTQMVWDTWQPARDACQREQYAPRLV